MLKKFLGVLFSAVFLGGCTTSNHASPQACINIATRIVGQSSAVSSPSIRIFGVGTKISMDAYASATGFENNMDCSMQALSPYLSKTVPNVVVFPEEVGLPLAFSGSKGQTARSAQSVTAAMIDLMGMYATSVSYYQSRYPGLGPVRYIFLALTDTMWRPFYDTFSALAKKYHSYIVACTDISDSLKESLSQQDIQEFGSPGETSVFLPQNENVYNTAFVFAPDGSLVGTVKKVNLVSEEYSLLNLTQGTLSEVTAVAIPGTPVKLGIAISLDAFTPSFLNWLVGLGANVVVQPDANDASWAGCPTNTTSPDYSTCWQPDAWLESTLGSVQQTYTTLLYDVNPMLTGNLFDVVFDGQSAITARTDPRLSRAVDYIGNNPLSPTYDAAYPAGGFLVLGPWVMDDPGITDTTLSLLQRRTILANEGASLTQTGSTTNRYISTIVWADISVQ